MTILPGTRAPSIQKTAVMESGKDRGTERLRLLEDDAVEGGNEPRRESRGEAQTQEGGEPEAAEGEKARRR